LEHEVRAWPNRLQWLYVFVGSMVVNLTVALLALELLCWIVLSGYNWIRPHHYQSEIDSPAYAGQAWVADFYREQSARVNSRKFYVPFRLWGVSAWHGKYLNVDVSADGAWRRSLNPTSDDCKNRPKASVWVFGGSTVFGTGVPDWATLPSYLATELNRRGNDCVEVTNFGVEGYVTTQEVILLAEQLKRGQHPTTVIFYDGFNDAFAGMNSDDPRSAHYAYSTVKERIQGSVHGRFDFIGNLYSVRAAYAILALFRRNHPLATMDNNAKAVATVDNYEANLALVRALSGAYHFKLYCFWQPMLLYGHKPLVPFEQQVAELDGRSGGRLNAQLIANAYVEAGNRSTDGTFVNLAGLFDSVPDPLYLDEAHLGPHGNELAANAIAKYVEDHPAGMELQRSERK